MHDEQSQSIQSNIMSYLEKQETPLRYEMGRTKVYFRAGALELLESMRLEERSSRVTILQAAARMWPKRVRYLALLEGARRGQTEWRKVSQRRRFVVARGRVIKTQVIRGNILSFAFVEASLSGALTGGRLWGVLSGPG